MFDEDMSLGKIAVRRCTLLNPYALTDDGMWTLKGSIIYIVLHCTALHRLATVENGAHDIFIIWICHAL